MTKLMQSLESLAAYFSDVDEQIRGLAVRIKALEATVGAVAPEPVAPAAPEPPVERSGSLLRDVAATLKSGEWRHVPTAIPSEYANFQAFQMLHTTPGSTSGVRADGMGWTERLVEHSGTLQLLLMREQLERAMIVMRADGVWERISMPRGFAEGRDERRPFNRWFAAGEHAYFQPCAARGEDIGPFIRTPLDNPAAFEKLGIPMGDSAADTAGNHSACFAWGRFWTYSGAGRLRSWAEGEATWRDHYSNIPYDGRSAGYAGTVIYNPIRDEVIALGSQSFGDSADTSYRGLRVNSPDTPSEYFEARWGDGTHVMEITAASSQFLYHARTGEYLLIYRDGRMYRSETGEVWTLYEDLNALQPWGRYEKYFPWCYLEDTDVIVAVSHIKGVWLHKLKADEDDGSSEEPPQPHDASPLALSAKSLAAGEIKEYVSGNLNSYDPVEGYWVGAPAGVSGAVGPMDSAWGSCMDVDPATGRMYFAGGRPENAASPQKMVWFDPATDQWSSKTGWSGVRGGHIYRSTCVIPEHRRVAYVPAYPTAAGVIPLWDIDNNCYAGTIPAPPTNLANGTSGWSPAGALVWHPELGARGSILWINQSLSRIARFDWATQAWVAVGRFRDLVGWSNPHMAGHYNPFSKAAIVGSSRPGDPKRLVIVEADGTTRPTAPAPCAVTATGHGYFVPHPTRNASISLCRDTGRVWSYEWDADEWVDRDQLPPSLDSANLLFASIESLGVIFAIKYGAAGTSKTYLYRPDF